MRMFFSLNRTKRIKCFYTTNWDNTKRTLANFFNENGYNVTGQFLMWRQNINNYWSFLLTDFFNVVDRTNPCALSNPWSSLFIVTFSALAFFISSWDNFFFLLLLLFFFFFYFLFPREFQREIWFQNQYPLFCIKGESP